MQVIYKSQGGYNVKLVGPNSPNTVNRQVFRNRQKSLAFLALVVSGITGLALILMLCSLRQYQLDSTLLAAIRRDDTWMVITALKDGANPNCNVIRTNDSFGPMGLKNVKKVHQRGIVLRFSCPYKCRVIFQAILPGKQAC